MPMKLRICSFHRDVTVYKLISKDTIEESILACAKGKLHLEQNVAGNFDEGELEFLVFYSCMFLIIIL